MLAPQAEAGYQEEALFGLCTKGLSLYPQFLEELSEDVRTAEVPTLDRCGSMIVAVTADDKRQLDRQFEFRTRLGCSGMSMISGAEAREREPLLSPKVKSALLLEDEAQINNRALIECLHEAFVHCGGVLHEYARVDGVVREGGRVTGVKVRDEVHSAESVTIAAGALQPKIEGIEGLGIRPVKGQAVALRTEPFAELKYLIRTPRVYLAAKEDGRLLVGASVEEKGYDHTITAGPILELLHYAWEVVPAIYELEIAELQTGLRPASRDHCPIIGSASTPGLHYATGHYRNGILLTPITAYAMRDLLTTTTPWPELAAFGPGRFEEAIA
jgi:glycine oxidase